MAVFSGDLPKSLQAIVQPAWRLSSTDAGSFWARQAQVDVVAISWRTKDVLLGACKWGRQTQGRKVVDTLKRDKVVPKEGMWAVCARRRVTKKACHFDCVQSRCVGRADYWPLYLN